MKFRCRCDGLVAFFSCLGGGGNSFILAKVLVGLSLPPIPEASRETESTYCFFPTQPTVFSPTEPHPHLGSPISPRQEKRRWPPSSLSTRWSPPPGSSPAAREPRSSPSRRPHLQPTSGYRRRADASPRPSAVSLIMTFRSSFPRPMQLLTRF